MSHLLQMRGLKLKLMILTSMSISVASFTDAWIETQRSKARIMQARSHLLQMRGLKPYEMSLILMPSIVASFTDAWIETAI